MIFSTFTEAAFHPFNSIFFEDFEKLELEYQRALLNELKTKEQIEELMETSPLVKRSEIQITEIRYEISPDQWWYLLNSAGYKGLISMIPKEKLSKFKENHLQRISELAVSGKITLNVDSFLTTCWV